MRLAFVVASLTLAGCSASPQVASLEAEVRRLRIEQERQASQIEQLQHRVVLTEDVARDTRRAVDGQGRMATIRLGAPPERVEPIRVDATERPSEPAPPGDESAPRTTVRIGRGDRIPEQTPFGVRDGERLQVVPVAPLPPSGSAGSPRTSPPSAPVTAPAGGASGPRTELPTQVPIVEGAGVLDPAAVPAYDAAYALVRSRRFGDAVTAFDGFLSQWPRHPHADNALYWRAQSLTQLGQRDEATRSLERLVRDFPLGNKAPDALFSLATLYRRAGDVASADRASQQLLSQHPSSDAARRMRDERP